ncbi:hypothetical protein FQN60_006669 [Etheostoma spectabile]|uniref:Uncharacterized protein n=1 Tax=Etheostoma spectabile TaxID=54343 RepID=A0A5J5CG74_9PERO|nr:hypothetical protein FQN60_006669 [Etheostoma spectabile]
MVPISGGTQGKCLAFQFQPDHRAGLPYQFTGSTSLDATTLAHHSKEQFHSYYRVREKSKNMTLLGRRWRPFL